MNLDDVIRKAKEEIKNKKIKRADLVNNYLVTDHSYLNVAIKNRDFNNIINLFEVGANPNGITSSGLAPIIPMTMIPRYIDVHFKDLVKILLKHGSDINQDDTTGDTILTIFCKQIKNINVKMFNDLLLFLLEKGADPNGTIFFNPLIIILESSLPNDQKFNICEILISYGANPNYSFIITSNNPTYPDRYIYKNITPSIRLQELKSEKIKPLSGQDFEKIKPMSKQAFEKINTLFNVTIEQVITKCESEPLISSLAKFYKLPDKKDKKELCKCIKEIIDNKDEYNEDEFINLRQKIREINNIKTENEMLTTGDSPHSYPDSELIYLIEDNKKYVFHISEIPSILAKQINPWTTKTIDQFALNEIVNSYKYIIPKTLEESLKSVFNFTKIYITNNVLVDKLDMYIKSFNHYIQTENIANLNIDELNELKNILYGGNNDMIQRMTDTQDFKPIIGESKEESHTRILNRCIMHLLQYIKNNKGSIPFISNAVNQIINDSYTAKEIINLFPEKKRDIVRRYILNSNSKMILNYVLDYPEFKKNIERVVVQDEKDVELVNSDKKFLNYLSDDQKNVINFLELSDFDKIYKEYLILSIDDILKKRFPDLTLNEAWNDIVLSIIRS